MTLNLEFKHKYTTEKKHLYLPGRNLAISDQWLPIFSCSLSNKAFSSLLHADLLISGFKQLIQLQKAYETKSYNGPTVVQKFCFKNPDYCISTSIYNHSVKGGSSNCRTANE